MSDEQRIQEALKRRFDLATQNVPPAPWAMPHENLGPCVICGEQVLMNDDPAEMHDPNMFDPDFTEEERMVAQERVPNSGVCHAQCGLDRGWVIS